MKSTTRVLSTGMSTIPDHIQQEADRATAEATGDHLYDHDVTFIYHDKDLDFVVEAVRYIEQQHEDLKVYYRRRDSLGPILTNMVNSIQNSCITVAVISQNFLDDTLSDYELQLAILTAVKKHGQGCLPLLLDNCKIPAALETIETYHHSRDTKNGFEDLSNLVKAHLCNARRGPCLPRIKCRGETAEPANGTALQRQPSVDTQTLKEMIIHEVLSLFYLMVFHLKVATRGRPEGRCRTCNGLGWLRNGSQRVMSFLQSAYVCLQAVCKSAMAPLHLAWKQVFRQIEDPSLMTYIGVLLYNSTNVLVLILLLNFVWYNDYVQCDSSSLSLQCTFLIVPFVKGHFCGQHTSAYRQKVKEMYECCKTLRKKKTRTELKRRISFAMVRYTDVRNCIIVSLGFELLQWAIIFYCTATGVLNVATLPTLFTFQLIILFLHSCYLVAHLWMYYHDSTMFTLIEKNRFHYPELMEDSNFHTYHKKLINFVCWYYKTGQFK